MGWAGAAPRAADRPRTAAQARQCAPADRVRPHRRGVVLGHERGRADTAPLLALDRLLGRARGRPVSARLCSLAARHAGTRPHASAHAAAALRPRLPQRDGGGVRGLPDARRGDLLQHHRRAGVDDARAARGPRGGLRAALARLRVRAATDDHGREARPRPLSRRGAVRRGGHLRHREPDGRAPDRDASRLPALGGRPRLRG